MIKATKKTFKRCIGVARIFDWRVGPNRKSHTMTYLNFSNRGTFYGTKISLSGESEVGAWVGM